MVWANYGTDEPGFCLVLSPNGTASFVGGFLFFNPVRWSYEPTSRVLSLSLSGLGPDDVGQFRREYGSAFDSATSTIRVSLVSGPEKDKWGPRPGEPDSVGHLQMSFGFAGYGLDDPDSVPDWAYSYLRESCPMDLPPRPSP
jgi:hypothetical protein